MNSILRRRRGMMGAQGESDIVWEWTPDKGMTGITMMASSGETPNYELLEDAMRLKGPNSSSQKWTGMGTSEHLNLTDFTVEVYYRGLEHHGAGQGGVFSCSNGAGANTGEWGYAVYYSPASGNPVKLQLRGNTTTEQTKDTSLQSSGVVKCYLNRDNHILKGSYPGDYQLSGTPATSDTISLRLTAFETNRKTYYVDITRVVVRKGDTT